MQPEQTKAAYEQKLQAQLDEWDAEIAKLQAKAEKAEADAKLQYAEQLEGVRAKRAAARAKLDELRQAGDDAWRDIKSGVDRAWNALGEAVQSAASRF